MYISGVSQQSTLVNIKNCHIVKRLNIIVMEVKPAQIFTAASSLWLCEPALSENLAKTKWTVCCSNSNEQ